MVKQNKISLNLYIISVLFNVFFFNSDLYACHFLLYFLPIHVLLKLPHLLNLDLFFSYIKCFTLNMCELLNAC